MLRVAPRRCFPAIALAAVLGAAQACGATFRVHAVIVDRADHRKAANNSNIVVWLTPLSRIPSTKDPQPRQQGRGPLTIVQHDKQFKPHLLVITVGSTVSFPNHDPFFHNVFSLYDGQRFDLGLYEADTAHSVRFDQAGICYIFCNIHPDMAAVVVVVKTPYYGVSGHDGVITFPGVPSGRYRLHVWNEHSLPKVLAGLTRDITVSATSHDLVNLAVSEAGYIQVPHKDLYGEDYEPPTPASSLYPKP
jgi:plastocyanin